MRAPVIRTVTLSELYPKEREEIVRRSPVPDATVARDTASIVEAVRTGGDAALNDANQRLGGGRPMGRLVVTADERAAALTRLDETTRRAIEHAADNIRRVHEPQRPIDSSIDIGPGVTVERTWTPLRRVGVYVPGGRAAYPSSLLMGTIPAQVAGVQEVVVVSPADGDGVAPPVLLAAAELMGVTEQYAMGGAQAIAALAYGTESIAPVDKIVGPGNVWVTAAKLAVYGRVAIDLPAGPSEALVIADDTADPDYVAADLLCQAEHGPDSPAILVAIGPDIAARVTESIAALLPGLERAPVLRAALADVGLIAVADNFDEAVAFVNDYAAEHVGVVTQNPSAVAKRITAAGSVFVGPWAPHSAGDYATGANHVLPTGGLATSHGPLAVEDFGSWRQVQTLTKAGLASLRDTVATLADAEGLTAHRLAVDVRFESPT